jgi:chromosome segregation protein
MYLSKLDIFGFKSFAQKVSLTFDRGLTSIVGPNGCGKTNVVDAIRWALGEQRPTTLRSDKMEDVIFNGTKSRKPLSVAEVSLTIENTKQILPTEFAEVVITRRVYRSGESEYYLNNTLCRLKDIRDLFMDTGMGADAYSVIELKMVETILSDKADERRRLFEEAAGVTKYKHRRKEAYRRLEGVQQDLTRVNDIVREVQKAVNSLERQAHKARRYNELAKELQELEIQLLVRDYASVNSKIAPLRQQLDVTVTEKNRIDVELEREETLLDVLRTELRELEDRIVAAQSDLSNQQTIIHGLEQSIATAAERKKSLAGNIERYEREKVELRGQRDRLERRQEELLSKLERVRETIEQAEQVYQAKKEELDGCGRQLDARKQHLRTKQDEVIGLLHQISELKNRETQIKARIDNIHGRIDYIGEENTAYAREIRNNEELVTSLTAEDRELRRQFAGAEVRVHQVENQKLKLQGEIESLRMKEIELRSELERKKAKADFLKGLVESFDGYSEGARYLMTSDEWKEMIEATVGEVVQVRSEHRIALEAALGEATGYVIVKNVDQAYAAIEALRKNEKGKATFICLDRIPSAMAHRTPPSHAGVIGWADSLITVVDRLRRIFSILLESTLVVESVNIARSVLSADPSLRCVTLDGEVITARGLVRGGSRRHDEGGHIGKRSQLEELGREVVTLDGDLRIVRQHITEHTAELHAVDVKKLIEEAKAIEQQTTSVEVRIATVEFEKKRAQETIERNKLEAEKLRQEIESLKQELAENRPAIQRLESEKTEMEAAVQSTTADVERMELEWNERSRITNEANVHVLTLRSEERSLQQDIEHATATIEALSLTFEQRTADIESAKKEIESVTGEIMEWEAAVTGAREEFDAIRGRKHILDQEFSGKRNRVHEIELKLKDERMRHDGTLKATHDLEIKIQELTMKAESLRTRAMEEFRIDLEKQQPVEDAEFDLNAKRDEARQIKDKLRAMGPVNFAAFDEYKSEKERLDNVVMQRDDLLQGERNLLDLIEEINTTAQRQFLETFGKIRENFIATFKGLFDEGDECDLQLEEGADPLEARIEITAKPRGKRPTSIDLLSGGEKTLTAIALLFAIYLVKPSPFCILDEVDAPLDDSNIDRFTRILKRFSDNTQFIVVTHNKRTMEAASALYGVTMEEEGVSKLVSVRFHEPAATA